MDARRSCQLGQTADGFLHLARSHHHQVRQLVHDDDDLGQALRRVRIALFPLLLHLLIIPLQVAHVPVREFLIPVFHLRNAPVQRAGSLLRIGDNRNQKMGDAVVYAQLHHLGIHQDQLDLIRLRLVEDAHDQRIDADGLSGTRGARDQHVRHFGDIGNHHLARDVLSHGKSQLRRKFPEGFAFQKLPEADHRILFVGHLDADGGLTRNGRFDPDIRGREVQLDIVR